MRNVLLIVVGGDCAVCVLYLLCVLYVLYVVCVLYVRRCVWSREEQHYHACYDVQEKERETHFHLSLQFHSYFYYES